MTTKQKEKDQPQKIDEQPKTLKEAPEKENQEDQLELDSDVEMEGLVDSITKKESSMKNKD